MLDIDIQIVKKCRHCRVGKNLHEFGNNVSSKDGKSCYCKKCRMALEQVKKTKNPENYKEEKRRHYQKYKVGYRDRDLKRKFGIGIEEYNRMFEAQCGMCKCCGVHQSELRLGLAVDHCHTTTKVRGLLCGSCNRAIGFVKDSAQILSKMIEYLDASGVS